jgi:hypothetical protein
MTKRSPFRSFKTSPEIIRLAVMLYVRFPLLLRNVEDLLHERGVDARITRFATVAKYNARISRPRLCGAAVLGNSLPSRMLTSPEMLLLNARNWPLPAFQLPLRMA